MKTLQALSLRVVVAALFLFVLFLVYRQGLNGGFFFDDAVNILASEGVKVSGISAEALRNVWNSGIAGPLGRPISMLTFAANYYFGAFNPYWFKLTNLFIHSVNAVLVYCLCLLLIKTTRAMPGDATRLHVLALIIAALWALNPIQVTSVLYVVQRMTSLSSMFVLIALVLHVWARQEQDWGRSALACLAMAWAVCLPLAMLSKETGILFVLYVAVYEAILHRYLTGRFDRFARLYLLLLGLASAVLVLYLWLGQANLLRGYETRTFTLAERVLTEPRIVWEYVMMISLPSLPRFGVYHDDFVISSGLLQPPETLLAIGGLVASVAVSWLLRIKAPIISFGIAWFLVGHSLESTIFPLELMHEHRNYLPSLGIVILIAPVLMSEKMKMPAFRLAMGCCVAGFVTYFALITHLRANMYENEYKRTQIEAEYHPDSVRAQYDAGAVLVNMYNRDRVPILASMADRHFERANSLDGTYKLALVGRLQLDCITENSARPEVYEELKDRIAHGKWMPNDRTVMHAIADMSNAGTLCLSREQVDALFSSALGNVSASVEDRTVVYSDYASYLWIGQNDYGAARSVLEASVAADQGNVLNRLNLLQLLRLLGDREGVLNLYADLKKRELGRRYLARFQAIAGELRAEGVVRDEN